MQHLALQVKSLATTLGGLAKAVKAPKKVDQVGKAIAKLLEGKKCSKKEDGILKTQLEKADARILVLEEQLVSMAQLQQKDSNAPTSTQLEPRLKSERNTTKSVSVP